MTRHSLLIGVESYDGIGGLNALTCPLEDVDALHLVVSDERYMGAEARVELLKDPDNSTAMRSLGRFLRDVQPDDTLIFYFSGHGMRDINRDLFLCFTDSDPYDLELTALNVRRLGAIFETKSLQRVLVILDCCYSGAAGAALTKDTVLSQLNDIERAMPDGRGVFVLSSAGESETSKEGEKHSVFTHHLVDGIKSGSADVDATGEITVQNIAQYLRLKVPEDAPGQTPHLSSKAVTGSFVIAHNNALQIKLAKKQAEEIRKEVFDATRDRILDAVQSRDASRDLMNSVMDWIENHQEAVIGEKTFDLLSAYGTREIGIVEFSTAWGRLDEPEPTKSANDYQSAALMSSVTPATSTNTDERFTELTEKLEELHKKLAQQPAQGMPLIDALISAFAIALVPVLSSMLLYFAVPAESFGMPRWESAWIIYWSALLLHTSACFIAGWLSEWPKSPVLWACGFLIIGLLMVVDDSALVEGTVDHGEDLAGAAVLIPWIGYVTYKLGRKLRK